MNCRSILLISFVLPIIPVVVLAQNGASKNATKPAPKIAAPSAQTPGNVIISNAINGGTSTYDDARGITKLTKDVTIVQTGEDFILKSQEGTYNRPKNQAFARRDLSIRTRDSTITGASLFADFNEKTLSVTDNVVVSAHGKSDGIVGGSSGFRSEVRRKPIKITCDNAEWNYETRQAVLTGNIKIYQEENTGTCASIFYDEAKNIVQLRGKANFGNTKKQTFIGEDLVVYIDSGQVESKKRVRVKIPSNDPVIGGANKPAPRSPVPFPTPGTITDEDLKIFNRTPAPKPTPTPEPTELPDEVETITESIGKTP